MLGLLCLSLPCVASVTTVPDSAERSSSPLKLGTRMSLSPSTHTKGGSHYVVFISRTPATLYINGRRASRLSRPGKTVLQLPRKITKGDIFSIVASPATNGKPGVMLLGPDVGTSVKWRGQFVLRDALSVSSWTKQLPFDSVCQWTKVRIVDGVPNAGASFIWPRGKRPPQHVARFRFVAGGGDTNSCERLATDKGMSVISVAATDRAWVFVNGHHVMDILSRSKTNSKRVRLSKGDVISVKARDVVLRSGSDQYGTDLPHEFGFVVDVHYKGLHITTRPDTGPWKVTAMYATLDPAQQFAFMMKGFDDCSWNAPVKPKFPPSKRAKPFPYVHGARYVWADNAQQHSTTIFARLVIEDDPNRCDSITGQGTDDDPSTCVCEVVSSAMGSVCYFFIDSLEDICDDRQCEPKYVCTGEEESPDSLICVKKHITHRIVHVGDSKCKLKPDAHHIYVPYHNN